METLSELVISNPDDIMKTSDTYLYSQSVDEIAAAFLDADFITTKTEVTGSRNVDVCVTAHEHDKFEVIIRREAPADVPRVLKSIVKPWNAVEQIETWFGPDGGPYTADIAVKTEGLPANLSAHITLTAKGSGCEQKVVTDIECNLPLVGKTLAKFIAKETRKALAKEHIFIAENA